MWLDSPKVLFEESRVGYWYGYAAECIEVELGIDVELESSR
jgi:hypothetical protein